MAKAGAWERHLQGPYHDQSDLFESACIESLGLFSVLRCDWSVEERPKETIEPLRFSKV